MSFWDELAKLGGASDETERAPAAPAVAPVPVMEAPVQAPAGTVEELTATGLLEPYSQPRPANYTAPRIAIPEVDNKGQEARQNEFSSKLEALKEQYKLAQDDARSRQMKQEMFAALGNNIGNIVGGAQAMNTKASVTPVQSHKIVVPDQMARVDKNHKLDYEGLIKQYKDLQDKGLTSKDMLYANIAQAQLDAGAARMNANIENTDRNAGLRGVGMKLKEQEGNEASDKQTATLVDIDHTLSQVDNILADASKFKDKLGPNAADYESAKEGRFGALVPGKVDPEYVAFRSNLKGMKAAYQKIISGLTLTETEMREMKAYVPHEGMRYDELKANAEAFKERAKELQAATKRGMKSLQGKNADGYTDPSSQKSPASASGPLGETTERNGKLYKWNATAGKYQLAQ